MKGVHHLAFRLAPGSGQGHGQGLGDAEWGKKRLPSPSFRAWYRSSAKALFPSTNVVRSWVVTRGESVRSLSERTSIAGVGDGISGVVVGVITRGEAVTVPDFPGSSTMVGAGRVAAGEIAGTGSGVAGGMVVGDAPVQPVSAVNRSKTPANSQFPCSILHRVDMARLRAMSSLSGV